MDASWDAWPEPRAPTPIMAIRTFGIFGAAKSPMYFAPALRGGAEACPPANAGSAAIAAVAPPRVLMKVLRSDWFGFLVFMLRSPARQRAIGIGRFRVVARHARG